MIMWLKNIHIRIKDCWKLNINSNNTNNTINNNTHQYQSNTDPIDELEKLCIPLFEMCAAGVLPTAPVFNPCEMVFEKCLRAGYAVEREESLKEFIALAIGYYEAQIHEAREKGDFDFTAYKNRIEYYKKLNAPFHP